MPLFKSQTSLSQNAILTTKTFGVDFFQIQFFLNQLFYVEISIKVLLFYCPQIFHLFCIFHLINENCAILKF